VYPELDDRSLKQALTEDVTLSQIIGYVLFDFDRDVMPGFSPRSEVSTAANYWVMR
jgi:hypothetical protein